MPRQGDVLLTKVGARPLRAECRRRASQGFPAVKGIVLAAGEATGHHHVVTDPYARLYVVPGTSERFLHVSKRGATLIHEEHDPIELNAGDYAITRQREYEPPRRPSRPSAPTPRVSDWRYVAD